MKVSALDESGKAIDWWFLYKVPKLSKTTNGAPDIAATGYEYVYYDQSVGKVSKSPYLLTDQKGALNNTLNRIFTKPDDTTGWVLYNDEMPARVGRRDNGNLGHTKGVLTFDTQTKTGLWLLHSWPKYAEPGSTQEPTSMFGQTFLSIKYIDLRPFGAPWAWPETKDHAQWGITRTDNWVCAGDKNRMISQEKRGGGNDRPAGSLAVGGIKQDGLDCPSSGQDAGKVKASLVKANNAGVVPVKKRQGYQSVSTVQRSRKTPYKVWKENYD